MEILKPFYFFFLNTNKNNKVHKASKSGKELARRHLVWNSTTYRELNQLILTQLSLTANDYRGVAVILDVLFSGTPKSEQIVCSVCKLGISDLGQHESCLPQATEEVAFLRLAEWIELFREFQNVH